MQHKIRVDVSPWILILIPITLFSGTSAIFSAGTNGGSDQCENLRPDITLTKMNDEPNFKSFPGMAYNFVLKIQFDDDSECNRTARLVVSSINQINVPCAVYNVWYTSDELIKSYIVKDGFWDSIKNCSQTCLNDEACIAYGVKSGSPQKECNLIKDGYVITPESESQATSGMKRCTVDIDLGEMDKLGGLYGPSSMHIFDTEYTDLVNLKEERWRKPSHTNIDNVVKSDVTFGNSLQMNYKALLAQSEHLMSRERSIDHRFMPTMRLTAGVDVHTDLVWVSLTDLEVALGDYRYNNINHYLPSNKFFFEDDFPSAWEIPRGGSAMLNLKLKILLPFGDLKFVIYPLGTEDAYHFGRPIVTFHGVFAEVNYPDLLKIAKLPPSGDLDVCGWTVSYPEYKFYHDCFFEGCDEKDFEEENYVDIKIPVTFLGFRSTDIILDEKDKKFEYWVQIHKAVSPKRRRILAVESGDPLPDGLIPTIQQVDELLDTVDPGLPNIYTANLLCPEGLIQLTVFLDCSENTEVIPVHIELIEDEPVYFGYIPSPTIQGLHSPRMQADFGKIYNFQEDNSLSLQLTLSPNASSAEVNTTYTCRFGVEGGEVQALNISVTDEEVSSKIGLKSLNVIDAKKRVMGGEEVAVELELAVPATVIYNTSIVIQHLNPGQDGTLRICSMEVVEAGDFMACSKDGYGNQFIANRVLEETAGILHLHSLCRISKSASDGRNKFRLVVRAIFESTPGLSPTRWATDAKIAARILGDWSNSKYEKVKVSAYPPQVSKVVDGGHERHENCLGGSWFSLGTGRSFCILAGLTHKKIDDQISSCRSFGGYIGDVRPEEWSTIQFYLYHWRSRVMSKKILTAGVLNVNTGELFWMTNRERFRIGVNETLNTFFLDDHVDDDKQNRVYIYLRRYDRGVPKVDGTRAYFSVGPFENPSLFTLCVKDSEESLMSSRYKDEIVQIMEYTDRISSLNRGTIGLATIKVKFRPYLQIPLVIRASIERDEFGPRICQLKLLHVGRNLPCVSPSPRGIKSARNSTTYSYESDATSENATLTFNKLANWGTRSTSTYMNQDHDVMTVGVILDTSLSHLTEYNLTTSVNFVNDKGYPADRLQNHQLQIKPVYKQVYNSDMSFTILVEPENETLNLPRQTCKRISFKIHTQSSINVWPSIENLGFDNGSFVTWCGFFVAKVGENYPCFNPEFAGPMKPCLVDTNEKLCNKTDDVGTREYWRSTYMRYTQFQHYSLVQDPQEDYIELELSVRISDSVAAGTVIPFKLSLCKHTDHEEYLLPPAECKESFKDVFFQLEVEDLEEDLSTTIAGELAKIHSAVSQPFLKCPPVEEEIRIRERKWINFEVTFPYRTTLPFTLHVSTETTENKTFLHLADIQFQGNNIEERFANVLGMDDEIDIRSTYNTTFYQSDNLTTFQQVDRLLVDFGYVTSPGIQRDWFGYQHKHGIAVFSVQVEASDHPSSSNGTTTDVDVEINLGTFNLKCSIPVSILRTPTVKERMETERPFLVINMTVEDEPNLTEPPLYPPDGILNISTLIYHDNISAAEGSPTIVRFTLDSFASIDLDSVDTNYTSGIYWEYLDCHEDSGSVKFTFENGIMFPDTVWVNFTLHLDPFNRRPALQSQTSYVFASSSCYIPEFDGYPAPGQPTVCSVLHRIQLPLQQKGCGGEIEIEDPSCQIQSNYVLSNSSEFAAINILNETNTWSAPVRSGLKRELFVEVDFQTVKRITSVMIGFPMGARGPTQIRLDYSLNTVFFSRGETAGISFNKFLKIKKDVVARVVRLVVVETNDATPSLKAVSMNSVKFFGCNVVRDVGWVSDSQRSGADWCPTLIEASSEDPVNYRHFAVDTLHGNLIYVCDPGQYREGMVCYVSTTTNSWIGLPQYVHHILGFSEEKGRVYMSDYTSEAMFSSHDGVRVEATPWDPSIFSLPGWRPSVVVPGLPVNQLQAVWDNSPYTANYYGIQFNGKNVINWQSCCLP